MSLFILTHAQCSKFSRDIDVYLQTFWITTSWRAETAYPRCLRTHTPEWHRVFSIHPWLLLLLQFALQLKKFTSGVPHRCPCILDVLKNMHLERQPFAKRISLSNHAGNEATRYIGAATVPMIYSFVRDSMGWTMPNHKIQINSLKCIECRKDIAVVSW